MRKVLLVDNSVLFHKIVTITFAQRNELEIVYASTYKEAELILKSGQEFFAAIVSIVLPDAFDGEMVDLSISYKVPTLVLTGSMSEDTRNKMSEKQIIDYVPKNTRNDIVYAAELIQTLLYFENKKVLVVSNNIAEKKLLTTYFTSLLLKTVHVSNEKEAVELIEKEPDIEIVATDHVNSRLNGLKLVQDIRSKYTRNQKMIFAFTSTSDRDINALFLKYGVNDIIAKPFSKEEFNARLFKELDIKKTLSETISINKTIENYVITSTTDERGIIRQVSDAFSEVSGYTKDELIGQPQNIVRHPDTSSEVFKDLWETIQSGKKWSGVVKNRKKDGGYYWVNAHIEPIFNAEGTITGYRAVRQDITAEKEVQETKKKLTDSIKFSSLIQHALLPKDEVISSFFNDFFILWEPKDVVGGDIYLVMNREDSCLVFIIDCAGHGVPGAFMTIITKNILHSIVNDTNFDNPALILQQLSKNIQKTLRQDDPNSKSDAGLDGGIVYYNKEKKKVIYAGAKTPLFYIQNRELKVFKSDRESIGYKKSNVDFEFKNLELDVSGGDSYFYITTDGFIDQNGGEDGFVLGKKRTQKLMIENHEKCFEEQKEILYKNLLDFQGENERDDDVTFFAFSIKENSEEKVEHFFKYNGYLTQDILGEIESELEEKHQNIFSKTSKKEKLYTVLYELGQNIIKYASHSEDSVLSQQPYIEISYNFTDSYFMIVCKNKVSSKSIDTIKTRIDEANAIEPEDMKDFYRELRKNKKYSHEKGAGIGFFEFAKRSLKKMRYSFDEIDAEHSYYTIIVTI